MPRRGADRHRTVDRPLRRTVRVRRDAVGRDGQGRMLIRAVVHARLLGLRLLTLDARVVVADADPWAMDWGSRIDPDITVMAPDDDRAYGDVETARALLAEGAEALARPAVDRPIY